MLPLVKKPVIKLTLFSGDCRDVCPSELLHGLGAAESCQGAKTASQAEKTLLRLKRGAPVMRAAWPYFGGAGVKTSRLCAGSGLGFGLGAFLVSFLPLSLLPMAASVPQTPATRQGRVDSGVASIQEHRSVERIALDRLEAGVANDAAQFFFCRAIRRSRSSDHILFQHHRAHIVAAEVEA